ncbi:MAG: polysaccharide deacetylase family protein [Phycisphaerales bacterium JB043]
MTIALWILGGLLLIGGLWYALPMLVRARQVRALWHACRTQKAIVLTYDDGPGESLTTDVLDVLHEFDARATFYLIASRTDGNDELLERIRREGHELCIHASNHPHAWKTLPWVTSLDYIRARARLHTWTGSSTLFRPPYGKWVLPTMVLAWAHRIRLGWWTHDSRDTHSPLPTSATLMAESIIGDHGGVVLMHDFDRQTVDASERGRYVVELTRALIERAREAGLNIRTQSQLLSGARAR